MLGELPGSFRFRIDILRHVYYGMFQVLYDPIQDRNIKQGRIRFTQPVSLILKSECIDSHAVLLIPAKTLGGQILINGKTWYDRVIGGDYISRKATPQNLAIG